MKKGDEGTVAKKLGKNGGGFKKFLLGVLGVVIVVYVVGCLFFNGRYYANTKINGIDAGLKTPAKVEELIAEKTSDYSLKLTGRKNVNDTIKGSDIGLRSEEHTSELQSRQYLVCRLLLEKKKKKMTKLDNEYQ